MHDATPQKIMLILSYRFGSIPDAVGKELKTVADQRRMELLIWRACNCPNVETFRRQLVA